jgi:hypothetical protein
LFAAIFCARGCFEASASIASSNGHLRASLLRAV